MSALVIGYSIRAAPRRRLVREVRITMDGLPRSTSLLFLADLHFRGGRDVDLVELRRFWQELRATDIECVLLGGDIVERDVGAEAVAAGLRAAFGEARVICVLGNHDVDGPDPMIPLKRRRNDLSLIRTAFANHSLTILEDAVCSLNDLTIAGVAWRSDARGHARLRDAMSRIPGPCLILAHSPDQVAGFRGSGNIAALCGHTHGGQVDLPWLRSPTLFVRNRLSLPAGVMWLGGLRTFVTTGWGQTYPLRIRVRPEIVVVRLVTRPTGESATMTTRVVRT